MDTGAHRKLDAFNSVHAQRKLPYYELLGVSENATQSDIVRAFRKLSLKLHPDKAGGSTEKFQELNKAYKCLKDEDSRRKYDECGFDEDNICTSEVDQFVDAFFGESARGVDTRSPDWKLNSIGNYTRINIEEVPLHMRDIVRIGLNYIVSLDHEFHDVVLMQHSRVDIIYLMIGVLVEGPLTQKVFDSEDSYTISYYDNPLQPGITPMWSDQNVLGRVKRLSEKKQRELPRKELNWEEFQRRQKHALAMLENAPADPMLALEEKYRAKMLATEHERHTRAILHQDIYENDAELDCNAFSNLLAEQKRSRGESSGTAAAESSETAAAPPPPQAPQSGDPELDSLLAVTEIECGYSADAKRDSSSAKETESIAKYASHGTKDVLGVSSDGVLFVAQGGRVLRNEAAPAAAAAGADKLEGSCSSASAGASNPNFLLAYCACLPIFFACSRA
eukprot:gnl/TRDRNA2_/TRDRNA2_36698_c0_seq1.p1 gnl/TRDRNA2_/TRDRNA2_36698_c0~~gnl/TRDRNA2_/TRDRNA2_36698_c0_seq1.p1  ORF type:complete len:449 (+),score=89.64 gnl/TRDRNA2_/TRDRNA2_36698_c0_seq1:45-1391(+)